MSKGRKFTLTGFHNVVGFIKGHQSCGRRKASTTEAATAWVSVHFVGGAQNVLILAWAWDFRDLPIQILRSVSNLMILSMDPLLGGGGAVAGVGKTWSL